MAAVAERKKIHGGLGAVGSALHFAVPPGSLFLFSLALLVFSAVSSSWLCLSWVSAPRESEDDHVHEQLGQ